MGAISPPAAGAAAGAFASQPQAGAAFTQLGAATPQEGAAQLGAALPQLLQPFPQLLLQLLQPLLQLLQAKIRSSRQGLQHLVPQPLLQPLLHDGAAAQVGPAAAQVGAAAAQVGAAFTQLGAATPQEGAAQLGAAFAHPLPQPFPQAGLQLWQLKMRSSKGWRQQVFPQPFPHLSAPQEGAAAQVGPAAAQVGPAAAQVGAAAAQVGAAFTQEGAATPHEGATAAQLLQPLLQQRVFAHLTLQHLVSQQLVSQPHPLEPSIRSSRSKPKLWVQAAMLSTNDPTKMFHFIERRLLITMEPSKLTHVPVRPDHANVFALPWGCGWSFAIGQVARQSNCLVTIAGLLGRWGYG